MRKVKVSKKSKNENSFRTPLSDLDYIQNDPIVGLPFFIGSTTHESGGILTSDLEMVENLDDLGFIIYTLNSVYKIEFI